MGRLAAQRLADAGASVLAVDVNEAGLRETAAGRPGIRTEIVDVTDAGAVTAAVEKALRHHVHAKDGLAQFLPDGPSWRQTTFDLAGRPHLRLVQVASADLGAYACLLGTGGQA